MPGSPKPRRLEGEGSVGCFLGTDSLLTETLTGPARCTQQLLRQTWKKKSGDNSEAERRLQADYKEKFGRAVVDEASEITCACVAQLSNSTTLSSLNDFYLYSLSLKLKNYNFCFYLHDAFAIFVFCVCVCVCVCAHACVCHFWCTFCLKFDRLLGQNSNYCLFFDGFLFSV